MNNETPFEQLEAASREVERLATAVAVRAKAFGAQSGERQRVLVVTERLKVALDELAAYPETAADITDE